MMSKDTEALKLRSCRGEARRRQRSGRRRLKTTFVVLLSTTTCTSGSWTPLSCSGFIFFRLPCRCQCDVLWHWHCARLRWRWCDHDISLGTTSTFVSQTARCHCCCLNEMLLACVAFMLLRLAWRCSVVRRWHRARWWRCCHCDVRLGTTSSVDSHTVSCHCRCRSQTLLVHADFILDSTWWRRWCCTRLVTLFPVDLLLLISSCTDILRLCSARRCCHIVLHTSRWSQKLCRCSHCVRSACFITLLPLPLRFPTTCTSCTDLLLWHVLRFITLRWCCGRLRWDVDVTWACVALDASVCWFSCSRRHFSRSWARRAFVDALTCFRGIFRLLFIVHTEKHTQKHLRPCPK